MGLTNHSKRDLINYRLAKADEVFVEAIDVISMNHWNLAVNRLYYAVFHICSALLLSKGLTPRSHSGLQSLMMREFVHTNILNYEEGRLISTLFNMRHSGDYDDLFDWGRDDVDPLIVPTKELLQKLKGLVVIPE